MSAYGVLATSWPRIVEFMGSIPVFVTKVKWIMLLLDAHLWCSGNGMDLKCKGHGIGSRLHYQSKTNHAFVEYAAVV